MTEERLTVNLSGKTAIVTGSSRGIGKAISFALSQAGANVVIAARSEEESPAFPGTIYKTVEEIKGLGGKALAVRCDVTEDGEVKSMVEQAVETYGAIDILVNNAGVMLGSSFLETGGADFSNSWRVNVLGPFLCTKAVLPHMIPRKSGSIVNISSGMAESNQPHSIIYSMSKVALNKMMLKLAAETTEYNIAVNLLYPHGSVGAHDSYDARGYGGPSPSGIGGRASSRMAGSARCQQLYREDCPGKHFRD